MLKSAVLTTCRRFGVLSMTVIAVSTRSGMVECEFHGHVVVTNPDASIRQTIGEPGRIFYPRSANKLMQAATMARLGLTLEPRLAALSASSHSGEEFHQQAALDILTMAHRTVADLDNSPDLPYENWVAHSVLRGGRFANQPGAELFGEARRDDRHVRGQRLAG